MRHIHIHYYLLHFHIYMFIIVFILLVFIILSINLLDKISLGDLSLFQNEFDDWNNTGAVLCNCLRFLSDICDVVILITR